MSQVNNYTPRFATQKLAATAAETRSRSIEVERRLNYMYQHGGRQPPQSEISLLKDQTDPEVTISDVIVGSTIHIILKEFGITLDDSSISIEDRFKITASKLSEPQGTVIRTIADHLMSMAHFIHQEMDSNTQALAADKKLHEKPEPIKKLFILTVVLGMAYYLQADGKISAARSVASIFGPLGLSKLHRISSHHVSLSLDSLQFICNSTDAIMFVDHIIIDPAKREE